jgi:hypothetical protein
MITKQTFENGDLNVDYQFVYNHNKNSQDFVPSLKDPDGKFVNIADLIATGDATGNDKDNYVTVSMNDPITGTWTLYLYFDEAGAAATGRRAFELSENNDPSDDFRLILGKEDTPSINIDLDHFYTLLESVLGFLKIADNLSDLSNNVAARTNLGVYSSAQVDAALALKASLLQAGSGAAMGVYNTSPVNPSAPYHPATKLYVDTSGGGRLVTGTVNIGDIGGGGFADFDISFANIGTTSYIVLGSVENEIADNTSSHIMWNIRQSTISATGFKLCVRAAGFSEVQDITFKFMIVKL